MEVDLFEFQSDSFPNVEGDFLSEDTGLIDFENTEFESVNFDHVPDLLRRDIPDLSSGDGSLEYINNAAQSLNLPLNDTQPNTSSEVASGSPSQKSHARFSKKVRSVLRTWFINHRDHPYPTVDERVKLEEETGLQRHQVSLWLANARRRNKPKTQHPLPSQSSSNDNLQIPGIQSFQQMPEQDLSMAMPPPPLPLVDTDEQAKLVLPALKPFDRWKVDYRWSQEPAEYYNISDAMARSPPRELAASAPTPNDAPTEHIPSTIMEYDTAPSTSEFDGFWAQSMNSYSTGLSGLASGSHFSDHTGFSYQHSNAGLLDARSLASFDEFKPRRRCKAKRAISKGGKFHCTFCNNRSFRTKHDWQRHEKSQHLNIESWACCGLGAGTIDTPEGPMCAFCSDLHPDTAHLETHHYSACQDKVLSDRTFYRKDHFKQHLVLTHDCGYNPNMDIWKVEFPNIISRCGFCNKQLNSWQERVDHIAGHFKVGSKMDQWEGGLGFEAHIVQIVDFGNDSDPKRVGPDVQWGNSSKATQVSSLDYQGETPFLEPLPDAPPGTVSGLELERLFHAQNSPAVLETGVGRSGLYDIYECAPGTCVD